jgi:hypothetical protein
LNPENVGRFVIGVNNLSGVEPGQTTTEKSLPFTNEVPPDAKVRLKTVSRTAA